MAYVALNDLKQYLGIETGDDDALLQSLLTAAQAMVDAWCRRTFEAATDTVRSYRAADADGETLHLGADLCAVASVVDGDETLVRGATYTTRPRADAPFYALQRVGAWGDGDILVAGRWAYATAAPADVVHATMRLAAYLYRQKDNAAGDLDRTIIAGNTTILPAAFPADVDRLLRPYRRVTV
jgi:hypothetical protein